MPKDNTEALLINELANLSNDPLGYVRFAYEWGKPGELQDFPGPHVWQSDILDTIGRHLRSKRWDQPLRIAVSSGRGIGKSALIAMIASWAKDTCEDCRVIVTANTEDQLATKTWPEIIKWTRRSITDHLWSKTATKICSIDKAHADTWRVDRQTWSENNVEAFRGLHNIGKRMVIIFDEAAGIPTPLWEATQGSLTDANTEMIWIAFSNPSQTDGSFMECFGRFGHRWITKQIDSRSVPGTNKEEIQGWIEDYGEDSDYVRVHVKGEFPRAGSSQFISEEVISAARGRDVGDQSKAYKIISVDVARFGDDRTVIGLRQGLTLRVLEKLRNEDNVQVANRVINRIIEEQARACVIDGDGLGAGVMDYTKLYLPERWKAFYGTELPKWFKLEEFHGGMTPGDTFKYFNRRAEMWGAMRDWLVTGSIPDEPEYARDLSLPKYMFSSKNQIQLEKKEDMKKRGLASPDFGDMLAMSFAVQPTPKTREEALIEAIAATEARDPMEAHFMRLRETERRTKRKEELPYWM